MTSIATTRSSPMTGRTLIEMRKVCRDTANLSGKSKPLLSDVTWSLDAHQRVAVFSSSPLSARAFLDCAAGVSPPSKGSVSINTNVSWPLGARGGILNQLTGRQNATLLQGIYGSPGNLRKDIALIQELSDLEWHAFDQPLRQYTKIMRDRLYLAISLAFDFDAYIIPKSFAWKQGPGNNTTQRFIDTLKERTAQKPLIMANSHPNFLAEFCTEGIVLHQGRLVHSGDFNDCHQWFLSNIKAAEPDNSEDLPLVNSEDTPETNDKDDADDMDDLW